MLEFKIEQAGRYRGLANLTKAADYGVVRLRVDDHPQTEFDRYHTRVEHNELELGNFDLTAGAHRLVVEVVRSNPQAIARHMFGLDYLRFVPAPQNPNLLAPHRTVTKDQQIVV